MPTEILWDEASFEPRESYAGDPDRAERERIAMEALRRRIAERDAGPGYAETAPEMPAPPPAQPMPGPPPVGAPPPPSASPPMGAAPAPTTSPQPPAPTAEASTDPNAPTATAGAQAAELRGASALGTPTPAAAPTPPANAAPMYATGATGLGGRQEMPAAAEGGREVPFERQLSAARDEDERRRRRLAIMLAIAGIGGMASIGSGGSMGGALPGAIAAQFVRRPDEEETLRENDTRAREMGSVDDRRRALMEQIQLRRDQMGQQDRQKRAELALRLREMEGSAEDRRLRTGIALRENEREEDLLDPASDVSQRERVALALELAQQPREVQRAYTPDALAGMSATELRSLRDDLARGGRARTMAGGRGGVAGAAGGAAGLQGINVVPDSYVNMISSRSDIPRGDAQRVAQAYWSQMKDDERRSWLNSSEADRWNTRAVGGYEQTNPGQQMTEASRQRAEEAAVAEAQLGIVEEELLSAASAVEQMDGVQEAAVRGADAVGVELTDDVSRFNDARQTMIATLNRLAGGGTMDATEYARWDRTLPRLSDLRGLSSGDVTRRMRAAFNRARRMAEAEMRARGFQRAEGGGDAGEDRQAPSAPTGTTLVVITNRDGQRRRVRVSPSQLSAIQSEAQRRGWTVQEVR